MYVGCQAPISKTDLRHRKQRLSDTTPIVPQSILPSIKQPPTSNNSHTTPCSTTMAPNKQTETSSTIAISSNPKSPTHVADLNSSPTYADQSRSRLMTIPKEIRNIIYDFVFCDNIDLVREPIKYDWEVEAVAADAPTRVNLDLASPPSKGTILACRELYEEMKEMYAAAYRAYWSDNRFAYDAGRLDAASVLPADKDLQHIRHFCFVLRRLPNYCIHITFERGRWDSWLLPADGRILGLNEFGGWFLNQGILKNAVAGYMVSVATLWSSLDPGAGRGLTRRMLRDISVNERVIEAVECQRECEESGVQIVYSRRNQAT